MFKIQWISCLLACLLVFLLLIKKKEEKKAQKSKHVFFHYVESTGSSKYQITKGKNKNEKVAIIYFLNRRLTKLNMLKANCYQTTTKKNNKQTKIKESTKERKTKTTSMVIINHQHIDQHYSSTHRPTSLICPLIL